MAIQLPPGPLSGPSHVRNRRRNPFWRFRRLFFVVAIIAGVAIGAVWSFASQVELEEDNFDELIETTYICTAEVLRGCGPDNAANELAVEGQDRVVVEYGEIPDVLINAVVATEDQSFFEHRGVDPGGLLRAAYQVGKQRVTSDGGSLQGGSTITQQYIKLATNDDAVDIARKAREIVRAIKLEQELAETLGSTEAAKQQIIERYLNRAYFGRGVYGVQAASRIYFDKDVGALNTPEAAYMAGLLKNPSRGDAWEDPGEGDRRRDITLGQMVEHGYITVEEQVEAEADTWPNLIPPPVAEVGLGEVAGSEIGSEYFVSAVRRQLDVIYPEGEYFTQSLRVYTTLDPELQALAYRTITQKLDPNNEFMPLGSLLSLDENGEVVAMMGGASWDDSQVNLSMGTRGGGSGFQAGSQMKAFALAEYIEQGFSPNSLFEAPFTIDYPQDAEGICARWKVRGGVSNNPEVSTHRTVYQATLSSLNTVFAQMSTELGAERVKDMASRLGIDSDMLACPSLVLGPNSVSPLEMANAYSTLNREGQRLDPVFIERIEDADGNVLCWYPQDSCTTDSPRVRVGEQVVEPAVARQVNGALTRVVSSGTGRAAQLVQTDESVRAAAGKTGTTQFNRDAWFTGFTCGLTTSVWVGYPGVEGRAVWYMNDAANEEFGVEIPTIAELFETDEYNNSRGNGDITGGEIPTELWHDFMIEATEGMPPCEELAVEGAADDLRIEGQELLTTLLQCAEPDPALVAAAQTTTLPEDQPPAGQPGEGEDGGDGDDENALILPGSAGVVQNVAYRPAQNSSFQGSPFQGNEEQPQPTVPPEQTPTTEPCLQIDLEGNQITTTVPDPNAATTLADPNQPDPNDPNQPDPNDPNDPNQPDPNDPNQPDPNDPNAGNDNNGDGNNGNNGNGNNGNGNGNNNNGNDDG